ncbi:MAG: hypothetical protein ACK5MK_03710 [Dysgonomonas sp.]
MYYFIPSHEGDDSKRLTFLQKYIEPVTGWGNNNYDEEVSFVSGNVTKRNGSYSFKEK